MSQKENSGGLVNYYLAPVEFPQRKDQPAYVAECEDIIDALGLTPDEANIFKEIWRTANERTHGKGKEGNNPLRAAQKMVHYSGRILRKAERAQTNGNGWINCEGITGPKLDPDRMVEVQTRCGSLTKDKVGHFSWNHLGWASDIMKYRLV